LLSFIESSRFDGSEMNKARSCGLGLPLRASIRARGENTMMKRMILAGMLAATAVPVLASDASYDMNAAAKQSATASAASKTDGTMKHNCACCQKHHS
jgi:hypothetical protein